VPDVLLFVNLKPFDSRVITVPCELSGLTTTRVELELVKPVIMQGIRTLPPLEGTDTETGSVSLVIYLVPGDSTLVVPLVSKI
jgi:hypothetical protein